LFNAALGIAAKILPQFFFGEDCSGKPAPFYLSPFPLQMEREGAEVERGTPK